MGLRTLASRSPQTIRPAWGDRKLIGRPRMADSSQTPPRATVTAGRRRARAISLARDVLPQPGGPAKHRIGARVAGRAGRTTRRRSATGAEPAPRQDRAPRARPSRVHAVDVSRRVARNRRMRALISGRPAWAASSSAIAASMSTRSAARAVQGRLATTCSRSSSTAAASGPAVWAMRTSSRARASTGVGRSVVSRRSSTSWVVAANWSADGRSSSIAFRPSRTASTSSFGRLSLPSIFRASSMRASTCRICLRAASFQSPGATSRRASTMVRIPPMACSAACSKLRRALSHAVNNPSEGAFSAGSSSASRSRRRNDDGVGQIFMPEKSSRSRASSTFRRRLSMAQQVLATRSACSTSGSASPASPSRSRVTSCQRNAATSVRAASRSGTTDPSSVAINLSTDSSRPSNLDCPHSLLAISRN